MNHTGQMVLRAFQTLLSDKSASIEETLETLQEIREELDVYIEVVEKDLERERDGS